ncbi:MAG TPA: M14 family metallopeptidase [Anaerolineae bacterium]|nr:M14 family metallopeptidase [Anaerolineae bacterium]
MSLNHARVTIAALFSIVVVGLSCPISVRWPDLSLLPASLTEPTSRPIVITPAPTISASPDPNTENTSVVMSAHEGPLTYGRSFDGRPLVAYRLGTGPIARVVIGGLHGGYEWNTTPLMSRTLEHLTSTPDLLPDDLTLYVIPLANPDGAAAGTDRVYGRMNGNGVDLNRNWDYQWQMTATHGTRPVYAGAAPFSEPETRALRDFIADRKISAAIFYHSAGAVIYSGAGITTSQTVTLAQFMAEQTGYRYAPEGVPGQITTGDAIDYLTTVGITAVEIELTTHTALDWEVNLKALKAFLEWECMCS